MEKNTVVRYVILVVFVFLAVITAAVKLFRLQIVDGASYNTKYQRYTYVNETIKAERGEVLDRYGRPLIVNEMAYSVQLAAYSFPKNNDDKNAVLMRLIDIMDEMKQDYNDLLPVSMDKPFSFTIDINGETSEGKKLKNYCTDILKLSGNISMEDVLDAMRAHFGIDEGVDDISARKIAGARYSLDIRNFSSINPYTFAQKLTIETVSRISEQKYQLSGINIIPESVRKYMNDGYASHILGRVGPIYKEESEKYIEEGYPLDAIVGKEGAEGAFEQYLRPSYGTNVFEMSGNSIINKFVKEQAKPGNDVVLTLDMDMQRTAENALKSVIADIKTNPNPRNREEGVGGGAVAVVDVRNGEILALATYPTYDIADFNKLYADMLKDPMTPMVNRAIAGLYAPGSTYKMTTAISGLENNMVTPKTYIRCDGIYGFYASAGYSPHCWVYSYYGTSHGNMNVENAIKNSCNCYFYETARLLGIEKLNETSIKLGLGVTTGIEIKGESAGILAGKDYAKSKNYKWQPADTVQSGIGQSFNQFTPLQLASMMATIANGGTRYKTHLLKSVRTPYFGEIVYEEESEILGIVDMSKENYDAVMRGLRSVTEDGTASSIFSRYPIAVGGKTGTASVSQGAPNAVFVAFAPFEAPEIAIAVVIEHGSSGNWAAPIAKILFDEYFFGKQAKDGLHKDGILIE